MTPACGVIASASEAILTARRAGKSRTLGFLEYCDRIWVDDPPTDLRAALDPSIARSPDKPGIKLILDDAIKSH